MLRELEQRRRYRKARLRGSHAGEALPLPDRLGKLGCAQILELRLVIEQLHLRRRARLKQVDYALGFWREMG